MRTLIGDGGGDSGYAWPDGPWLRANMVTTVDGAAVGSDGRSGSINTSADRAVFHELRRGADAVLVAAGTARAEGYGVPAKPLVVVSGRGELPEKLAGAPPGRVRLSRGGDAAGLREMMAGLRADGLERVLCEGGPRLLGGLLAAGLVDELCATISPKLVGGDALRIVTGPETEIELDLVALHEEDGTLLGRWRVRAE